MESKTVKVIEAESRRANGRWTGKGEMLVREYKVLVRQEEYVLVIYCTAWGLQSIIMDISKLLMLDFK